MREIQGWVGWVVDDVNGSAIGRLQDVIAGADGRPAWLILNEFRFGEGRRFTAPARDATGSRGRVWLPLPRHKVRATARLGLPHRSAHAERDLRLHYGLPEGRAAG